MVDFGLKASVICSQTSEREFQVAFIDLKELSVKAFLVELFG